MKEMRRSARERSKKLKCSDEGDMGEERRNRARKEREGRRSMEPVARRSAHSSGARSNDAGILHILWMQVD